MPLWTAKQLCSNLTSVWQNGLHVFVFVGGGLHSGQGREGWEEDNLLSVWHRSMEHPHQRCTGDIFISEIIDLECVIKNRKTKHLVFATKKKLLFTSTLLQWSCCVVADEEDRRCEEDLRKASHPVSKRRALLEDIHRTWGYCLILSFLKGHTLTAHRNVSRRPLWWGLFSAEFALRRVLFRREILYSGLFGPFCRLISCCLRCYHHCTWWNWKEKFLKIYERISFCFQRVFIEQCCCFCFVVGWFILFRRKRHKCAQIFGADNCDRFGYKLDMRRLNTVVLGFDPHLLGTPQCAGVNQPNVCGDCSRSRWPWYLILFSESRLSKGTLFPRNKFSKRWFRFTFPTLQVIILQAPVPPSAVFHCWRRGRPSKGHWCHAKSFCVLCMCDGDVFQACRTWDWARLVQSSFACVCVKCRSIIGGAGLFYQNSRAFLNLPWGGGVMEWEIFKRAAWAKCA